MIKKLTALFSAAALVISGTGCSDKGKSASPSPSKTTEPATIVMGGQDNNTEQPDEESGGEEATEPPTTKHISPVQTVTAEQSVQINVNQTIQRTEGSNTIKLPLADFIEDDDVIKSFTFVVYSGDGTSNIGEYKGGWGISVNAECTANTDEGWFQSENFTAPTQGSYGEISWNVPEEIGKYVPAGGEVLFGYWWGNCDSIRIDSVICNFTRTREVPVDGETAVNVGRGVNFSDADNTIRVLAGEFMPPETVPQVVTYTLSSSGGFGKFTGAFGFDSDAGYYQSPDTAVFTDASTVTLTWFVPDKAKALYMRTGSFVLGYWWSNQPSVTLDSMSVKYSEGAEAVFIPTPDSEVNDVPEDSNSEFRTASQIVDDIRVGWNLGNTLDSYNTSKSGVDTETGWGNVKTTKEMITSVKNAGFNAIRIPVTWSEHMDGDVIQEEWLNRVQEVVDYAYSQGLYVIINMHHDDYIWFKPTDATYDENSAKLKAIWSQVSERFADYGDRLIFEGMNEPRTVGSANEWMGGTSKERAVLNKYTKDFVDTVRASGGKNAERSLIITSYAASAETAAINDVVVPSGKNIIVSVHYYAPWKFSEGQETAFTDSGKSELDNKFAALSAKFRANGTPVIIGEFGCVNAADEATRSEYYSYYISSAKANGIKCFIWDNGIASGESSFGIFSRTSLKWNDSILNAVMNAAK